MSTRILIGDALEQLRTLPDCSIHCCVTSPPYWGLRDYGIAGQLGLEATPEEYIARMVEVFREVGRVVREDGTLWLNIGDSYNAYNGNAGPSSGFSAGSAADTQRPKLESGHGLRTKGLKPKDLVGIPWRLAVALQADGWWLRSDIIWAKPNPMPESVTDRPTKAHEYVYLLAKGQWKTSVVKFSDLDGERIHLGQNLRAYAADAWPRRLCVLLASAIFDAAQREQNFGLPPFYSQEWKQRTDDCDSHFVAGLPPKHRSAVWAARFLDGDATAKEFLEELNRLRLALGDCHQLLIGGVPSISLDAPAFDANGEGTITIHDSGKVGKIEFAHNRIIARAPMTCKYYYDQEAVREPAKDWGPRDRSEMRGGTTDPKLKHHGLENGDCAECGRNLRSVWTIPTHPFPEAHFATFPPKLVEPCIKAGTSERGCCPECGAPWERVVERTDPIGRVDIYRPDDGRRDAGIWSGRCGERPSTTIGFRSACAHDSEPVPCVVLDPFLGAGTTALVADRLGRDCIGIELNPKYAEMARRRIERDAPLFARVE